MSEHFSATQHEKEGRSERPHHGYHKKPQAEPIPRGDKPSKAERLSPHAKDLHVGQTAIKALTSAARHEAAPVKELSQAVVIPEITKTAEVLEPPVAPEIHVAPETPFAPAVPVSEVPVAPLVAFEPEAPTESEAPAVPVSQLISEITNYDDVDLDQLVIAATEARAANDQAQLTPVETPHVAEAPIEPPKVSVPATVIETKPAVALKPAPVVEATPVVPINHVPGDPAELNGEKVYIERKLADTDSFVAYEVSKAADASRVLAYEKDLVFLDPEKEEAIEEERLKELWDANSGSIKANFNFAHLGARWTDPNDSTINRHVNPNAPFEDQEAQRLHNRTVYLMGVLLVIEASFLTQKDLHRTKHLFNTDVAVPKPIHVAQMSGLTSRSQPSSWYAHGGRR